MVRYSYPVILFVLLLNIAIFAQDDADKAARQQLAGTWVLNTKKSSGSPTTEKTTWTITVAESQILIQKSYYSERGETTYTVRLDADNRGESNVIPMGSDLQRIVSKTKWDKRTLTRKYSVESTPRLFTSDVTEKYRVSKDGKSLTVESARRSNYPDLPGSGFPVTFVFDRQP